jgi:hypothetical protein
MHRPYLINKANGFKLALLDLTFFEFLDMHFESKLVFNSRCNVNKKVEFVSPSMVTHTSIWFSSLTLT